MTQQRIIDLDLVAPETIGVRIQGQVYAVPGDIPVPDYLAIAKLMDEIGEGDGEESGRTLERLYEQVLDLFRICQPDLEDLPIGPQRLGALVVELYATVDEPEEEEAARPRKRPAGTRSTSRPKQAKSRSSRS